MPISQGRRPLDFEAKKQEFLRILEDPENRVMSLATSQGDAVTARQVLVVNDGLDIYFFTWDHSRKATQIRGNPRVALCNGIVQIEGEAKIVGGLRDEAHKAYVDIFRRRVPAAIERWKDAPSMVLVRIRPACAITAGSSTEETLLEVLDLANGQAYAEPWACY